jgi:hypothetical protein
MDAANAHEAAPAEIQAVLDLACGHARLTYHAATPGSGIPLPGATHHTATLEFMGIAAVFFGEVFVSSLPSRQLHLAGKRLGRAAIVAVERAGGTARTRVTIHMVSQEISDGE